MDIVALFVAAARALEGDNPRAAAELRGLLDLPGITPPVATALRTLWRAAEQKAAVELELARVQERAQLLSEASFEGLAVHIDGVIVDVNQRLAHMLGYEPSELIGRKVLDLCPPEDMEFVARRMREGIQGEYVAGGMRKDGSRFRAEILSRQARFGTRAVRVSAIRDVTERELTSAMLRESEARLRELAQAAFDILVYSRQGVIVDIVGRVEETLGRPKELLVGRRIVDLVTPETRERARQALEIEKGGPYTLAVTGAAGADVPIEVVAVATTLNGIPTRVAGVRDMREARRAEAERRALEQQLQQRQRLESLGVLAGGIAHDFNNLLVGIIGGAELLELAELDASQRDSVRAIREAGERAATLTAQLLAYAGQRDLGQREPIALDALVEDLRRLLGPTLSQRAQLTTSIAPDAVVLGNRATLLQVLMNLLTNASDALGGQAGTISVTARVVEEPGERFARARCARAGRRYAVGADRGPR